ncbi:beta-1,4-galactosyltransferase 5-like [Scleropages formosus]|uniref:Beta-1,4-galactosyltransferase n=1 Tax=Scleropages formosus TaxID=113540 RepID=A0A0P7Y9T6_SCLFO|nr:beta-1,4-galactosyltransferase 5-like [Scleropages formosus]
MSASGVAPAPGQCRDLIKEPRRLKNAVECIRTPACSPPAVNEYLFMVQARGIRIQQNVRTFGAQVLEQVVRGTYRGTGGAEYFYNLDDIESQPTSSYLPSGFTYLPSERCPEKLPSMVGRVQVNMSEVALPDVEKALLLGNARVAPGGHWDPQDCLPRWKVAILIPFRNRHEHLPILLRHLIPMLQRQRLQFAIYVIEQAGDQPFNRAMLFNVGFREAMQDITWDCVIFHDVDHIPENDRNYYGCGEMPRHFTVKLDKYSYMLPYNEFFGGVSGLTAEQFRKINGFPNAFWGWGGEDDDLWNRVQFAGYTVSRPPGDEGRYMSIPHHHRGEAQFLGRYALLRHSKERQKLDGLNNLQYIPQVSREPLYTNITVKLSRDMAPMVANS